MVDRTLFSTTFQPVPCASDGYVSAFDEFMSILVKCILKMLVKFNKFCFTMYFPYKLFTLLKLEVGKYSYTHQVCTYNKWALLGNRLGQIIRHGHKRSLMI